MNIKINDFGLLNNIDMDIGKVNIIAGHNNTGKSQVSKLLYCFLKANCHKRQDFAYESLIDYIDLVMPNLTNDFTDVCDFIERYEKSKDDYLNCSDDKFIRREIHAIDDFISEIRKNDDSLSLRIFNQLLKNEFDSSDISDDSFDFKGKLDIYDVFYIDSFSIFDLNPSALNHVGYLKLSLRDNESLNMIDEVANKNIVAVENKIKDIIGGKLEFSNDKFTFLSSDNSSFDMQDTASGIKQIAIIQMLLSNRKLKEDTFLIIDEPEANLHPHWQFKLAEILVFLVKELNISVYINSHSSLFIESMEVFSNYYGLKEDFYCYLCANHDFKYIPQDNLYELYDDLSQPYFDMRRYRIQYV